ncbi:Succinylglutamate desuccinylase/aspartoacylase [Nitrosococcus oceani ATCC 19707]|uniref:Succinylglutamate desuccinylase/aspartoacylase n=2 Tax=Nitrosococcus oceani TaxID=1229 RepID=Q3JAW4_NITOC|nr:succinylglutamate desuccinylase/aspartoacylase family protein [Nitrosococcus oceani]ABA58032.1 Succinylglutamate desuccinylase/aspartoacylase [Nitrosococcus oceani ATCC 19707]EDZ66815.1 Succinylglutamate desuccinylase / Aspartoacylase family [Nitrosococcus oceani AFC27]KFI19555.1 succinylglutamate desuccinylase [Nitrosococcus oceani C-27]GEM21008.1 succinylglutamate desuccinylase [Nitrosococcus oceani]
MGEAFQIGAHQIGPGERITLDLSVPQLYTHTAVSMPIQVINGKRSGPKLFISAAIHGDEINGIEIIRRLVGLRILQRLRGTLLTVPVVNVYGFVNQSRYLPDRRDLNRSFPGSKTGSLAARLAYLFMEEIVARCTHGIDLHTAAIHRDNLPQIRTLVDNPETKRLAHAFGSPVILNSDLRDGSLRHAVADFGIPVLVYEGGEALRFNEFAIRAGVSGIVSVMRELEMLPPRQRKKPRAEPVVARSSNWVRAPQSGILRSLTALGDHVKKGDTMAMLADPFGEKTETVIAPFSGIVVGRTNLPLVHEGEALYHLAQFGKPETVAEALEAFQQEYGPGNGMAHPEEPPIL